MSYKSAGIEQAYNKLYEDYIRLLEYLEEHAPLTLQAFNNREK